MTYSAPPARTEISDTYPNPSNAVARVGFGKLWDYVTGLLGSTGSPAAAKAALLVPQDVDFTNRIINGAMVIDQRNAGASVTPTSTSYTLDRWVARLNVASKFSVKQTTSVPAGFTKSLAVTSTSAYTIGADEFTAIGQAIEGLNVFDFGWGAAGAQSITVSFWVRSSLTGTFGGSVTNYAGNRSYPFTYAISAANTWEQKSVTIAGDLSGAWLTTNGTGLQLFFGLGCGSSWSGTAGAWNSNYDLSATGAVSVVGTSGATLNITGVQLEKGTAATGFAYRPYGTELALCQRYYVQDAYYALLPAGSITLRRDKSYFPVAMRTTSPTVTFNDQAGNAGKVYRNAANQSASIFATSDKGFSINITTGGAVTGDDLAFNWFSTAEL